MATTLSISSAASPFPYAALATAAYSSNKIDISIEFDVSEQPQILHVDGKEIIAESDILEALARKSNILGDSTKSAALLALAKTLPTITSFPDLVAGLDTLDDHLAYRTFLVGHTLTVADFAVWGSIKSSTKSAGVLKNGNHPHVQRWFSFVDGLAPIQEAVARLIEARSTKARNNKVASSFTLGLPNAIDGQVVTRFPPEPSGYLHIGHAKAAMLNQYFAQMYHGKLIIRFDDTNPSKETAEFEETILEDLRLMDIVGDQITHTSDHFQRLFDYGVEIIKRGKAYADDTERAQMQDERRNGIASKRRDATVEENLARFDEMAKGTEEGLRWCIRAKISVDDNNKTLRDPVIFRTNVTPHHRTGSTWKVYPTYDFACPVVDSIEGVTHALRTNEYRDRNPQYHWMIDALGLRKVDVWDFSRLNFIYTLLSKRNLRKFVERGLVRGWDDPRFPTVRGIRRRGLTVEALRQYMLSQGPSQSVVSLEWDSIWTINKKIIDPIAPRYWAVETNNMTRVVLKGQIGTEARTNPLHKKNSDIGTKTVAYSPVIYVDQADAASFEDNEEITLMDWGNAFVRTKTTNSSGVITEISMELFLEGDFKKTKKKITWLSEPTETNPHISITLLDYDYLITKKKLEEDDDLDNFVTPVTEFKLAAVTDSNILKVKRGETIQFERKGYYILDEIVSGSSDTDKNYQFVNIPDGRVASLASKSAVVAAPSQAASSAPSQPAPTTTSKMYKVDNIYGDRPVFSDDVTKMYKVESPYKSA
ncbi:glutamate-tRNA ligase [Sistotremastrum niveocremeum HHB9708]|uniref:glutamate--tRNA ligase n=1 Tax=Sistotremastrum niveocremeum HHB9708 TaxID=1314777 RepID=A0A164P4C4_9AGAM|nr:glutamate-tRNA ligase [Sistotremastrum niveocremeum HHB9708]